MIPTMLLVGLVLGRWWRVVIPVGAAAWAVALVVTGVGSGVAFLGEAALFAAVNIAVGALVFQGIYGIYVGVRFVRHTKPPAPHG